MIRFSVIPLIKGCDVLVKRQIIERTEKIHLYSFTESSRKHSIYDDFLQTANRIMHASFRVKILH